VSDGLGRCGGSQYRYAVYVCYSWLWIFYVCMCAPGNEMMVNLSEKRIEMR